MDPSNGAYMPIHLSIPVEEETLVAAVNAINPVNQVPSSSSIAASVHQQEQNLGLVAAIAASAAINGALASPRGLIQISPQQSTMQQYEMAQRLEISLSGRNPFASPESNGSIPLMSTACPCSSHPVHLAMQQQAASCLPVNSQMGLAAAGSIATVANQTSSLVVQGQGTRLMKRRASTDYTLSDPPLRSNESSAERSSIVRLASMPGDGENYFTASGVTNQQLSISQMDNQLAEHLAAGSSLPTSNVDTVHVLQGPKMRRLNPSMSISQTQQHRISANVVVPLSQMAASSASVSHALLPASQAPVPTAQRNHTNMGNYAPAISNIIPIATRTTYQPMPQLIQNHYHHTIPQANLIGRVPPHGMMTATVNSTDLTCVCPVLHHQHHCRLHQAAQQQRSLLQSSIADRITPPVHTHLDQQTRPPPHMIPNSFHRQPQIVNPLSRMNPINLYAQSSMHAESSSGRMEDFIPNSANSHHPIANISPPAHTLHFIHSALLASRLQQQEQERQRNFQFYQQTQDATSNQNSTLYGPGRFMRLPQPFFVSPATVVPPVSIVPPPVELLVYPPTTAEVATAAHIVLNGASVVSELNSHVSMGLHQAAAVAAAGAAIVEPQPVGVNPDQIEKHSSRINYMTLQDEKGDKERCTVCLVDFEKADELRSLQCQHIFHVDCIDRWLIYNKKCPICRVDMDKTKMMGSSSSFRESFSIPPGSSIQ